MLGRLLSGGWEFTDNAEEADVIVVNTCSFIRPATEESIETVLELGELKKHGRCKKLVVAGCMVQRYGHALERELPEVDHFLGTGEYHRIDEVLRAREARAPRTRIGVPTYLHDESTPRLNSWKRHSAWLKVSEGCDHRCTFCIIPSLRGRMRSRTIPSLVAEAERLVGEGVVELNLVSQDTTAYGRDLGGGTDLGALVRALCRIDGLCWLRLHYLYPMGIPESLLRALAEEDKLVPYLDIPLQHASGRVLKAMRRGVTRAGQERVLERILRHVPDVALRTTFIVGFPGETEADFAELVDFVETWRFDRVGVFTWFPEEGTPAARLPGQVPEQVRIARQRRLLEIQARISREKLAAMVGRVVPVLVDGPSAENELVLEGRLPTQAPEIDGVVFLDEPPDDVRPGQIRQVRVTRSLDYDLVGRVVAPVVASGVEAPGGLT